MLFWDRIRKQDEIEAECKSLFSRVLDLLKALQVVSSSFSCLTFVLSWIQKGHFKGHSFDVSWLRGYEEAQLIDRKAVTELLAQITESVVAAGTWLEINALLESPTRLHDWLVNHMACTRFPTNATLSNISTAPCSFRLTPRGYQKRHS